MRREIVCEVNSPIYFILSLIQELVLTELSRMTLETDFLIFKTKYVAPDLSKK